MLDVFLCATGLRCVCCAAPHSSFVVPSPEPRNLQSGAVGARGRYDKREKKICGCIDGFANLVVPPGRGLCRGRVEIIRSASSPSFCDERVDCGRRAPCASPPRSSSWPRASSLLFGGLIYMRLCRGNREIRCEISFSLVHHIMGSRPGGDECERFAVVFREECTCVVLLFLQGLVRRSVRGDIVLDMSSLEWLQMPGFVSPTIICSRCYYILFLCFVDDPLQSTTVYKRGHPS